ncbi:btb (poz) domain-containing 2a-related [Anaeramoeba flamelloides]|uniref:Btb (Poz) domain-containing 2a-related n=1 Tax=Anaeramoeba flamelloides TaxID=1746091 RepID=A0ABQ8XM93_9EUKA|nr:btb (poz) domain-containing 2a-related [Anaeramoeba flamelloides]
MTEQIEEILKKYVNNKDLADVKFIVGKNEDVYYGHKLLLGLVSEFWFNKLYCEGWKEKQAKGQMTIKLPELDPSPFGSFLEYVYTRRISIKNSQVFELWKVADEYGIPQLKKQCADMFEKKLNGSNVLNFYEFGIKNGIEEWNKVTKKFLVENTKTIFTKVNCLEGVQLETIQEVLKIERLLAREIDIFKALHHWATKRKETTYGNDEKVTIKSLLKDFLPSIRLDLMSFVDIAELEKTGLFPPELLFDTITSLANKHRITFRPYSRGGAQLSDMKVLLCGGARGGMPRLEHLKESFTSGGICNIDIVDINDSTPTFETMNKYDAIILRSRRGVSISNNHTLGNNLGRFVETGKGLVVIAINSLIDNESYQIKGKLLDEGFIPLVVGERVSHEERELGEIHLPDHPIMNGVSTFKTKDYTHIIGTHDINGGKLIASWNNGFPLITEKKKEGGNYGTVVCLNFHPMSTRMTMDCGKAWLQETDGEKILSNSLKYVILY